MPIRALFVADIMEVSVGREEVTPSTAKMPGPSLETEEFEAIKVEDFCDNAKKDEVALISHCGDKSTSLEAIKVETFWEDAEKDEVALISHFGDKNTSLKVSMNMLHDRFSICLCQQYSAII